MVRFRFLPFGYEKQICVVSIILSESRHGDIMTVCLDISDTNFDYLVKVEPTKFPQYKVIFTLCN